MKQRGLALTTALVLFGLGRPAMAQDIRYSGTLSYSTGSYVFTERTHSLWLTNGVGIDGSRVSAWAGLPLVLQNSGVVSLVAGQPVPTGGAGHAAVGRRSGDGPIGTRRRGSGDAGGTSPDSATVAFRNAYELEVGDPSMRLSYEAFSGLGFTRSFSLTLGAKAPIRGVDSGVGTGAWDVGAGAALAMGLGQTWLFLDGAYWWFGDMPDLELQNAGLYSVGISRLLGGGGTSVLLSVSGSSRIVPTADPPLSASLGVSRFLERRRSLSVGVGMGLSESSPDVSAYVGWGLPVGGP